MYAYPIPWKTSKTDIFQKKNLHESMIEDEPAAKRAAPRSADVPWAPPGISLDEFEATFMRRAEAVRLRMPECPALSWTLETLRTKAGHSESNGFFFPR